MLAARAYGILLHPTSLPGPWGCGNIGPEAHKFIGFLASAGASYWQTLPINPADKAGSPYATSSSFAGEPLLIDIGDFQKKGWLTNRDLKALSVGDNPRKVQYPRVRKNLLELQRRAFQAAQADGFLNTPLFKTFVKRHRLWLDDFALFEALSFKFGHCDWTNWPAPLRDRKIEALVAARQESSEVISFVQFQQFFFDQQWGALRRNAKTKGIRIIGDLPIFVAHQSADVWSNQELFLLHRSGQKKGTPKVVAGCPPDRFNPNGQLWGNALYDWPAMRKKNYSWWLARLQRLLEMFDLIRLDHFIGFYRFWAIPAGAADAKRGNWGFPPGEHFFQFMTKKIPNLPLIAEDLGLVTPEVIALRDRFNFPGMRIVQFGFSSGSDAAQHVPHAYVPNSVAYSGTHDNETAAQYWLRVRNTAEGNKLAHYLGISKAASAKTGAKAIVRAAMASTSQLAVLPMQDVLRLSAAHRMNIPGTAKGNWTWRVLADEFTTKLREELSWDAHVFERHSGRLIRRH